MTKPWWWPYRWTATGITCGYAVLLAALWWSGKGSETANATTAYFLITNLVVLWWYAHVTQEQLRLQASLRHEANKPIGFLDRKRVPELEASSSGEHVRYVIRNVAPGLAVNMFHVVNDGVRCAVRPIGALEGHSERTLSEDLEQPLRDRRCTNRIVVVAEGVATRTNRWTATVNVLLASGEIAHRIVWGDMNRGGETLQQWMDRQWSEFNDVMVEIERESRL